MQKIIQVAVAVIVYQNQFLLGFRHENQHQGNRYEFIGGKIEQNEKPILALWREVQEEISIDISQNLCKKMGVIKHEYSEKTVELHIFWVDFYQNQYQVTSCGIGAENQPILWVEKADLLAKKYPLPEANARILDWICLPDTLIISKALQDFANIDNWLNFYTKSLPKNALFYARLKDISQDSEQLLRDLQQQRTDLTLIVPQDKVSNSSKICHLNHTQLMNFAENLPNDRRYFASCHDKISVEKANQFAKSHCLVGIFISSVKNTPTHPDVVGMGWQDFADLCQLADVPVFALGGMQVDDLPMVWQSWGFGIAGIRLLENLKGDSNEFK